MSSSSKSTLHVSNLHPAVSSTVLTSAFIPFGPLVSVSLPKPDLPSSTDPHRGWGYVEFENETDAREAIDNMDGSELFGKIIKVTPAKTKDDGSGGAVKEGLGSRVAIWEQEGYLAKHAVSEEDRKAMEGGEGDGAGNRGGEGSTATAEDPMKALEEMDIAGPKPE